jgi:hypothetical protein
MGMKNYQKSKITPPYATDKEMKIMAAGEENVKTSQVRAAGSKKSTKK